MGKPCLKTVIQSGNWIITKVLQGSRGNVRIDARTRFYIPDGVNRFRAWGSLKYINRIRHEVGLGDIEITHY